METTVILGVLIVLFIITWIVIACNTPTDYSFIQSPPIPSGKSLWEVNEIENLRQDNIRLRSELMYTKRMCEGHHQPPFHGNCCWLKVHDNLVQKPSAKEQEFAEIIKKGQKSTIQLMKDLGIKEPLNN